MSSQMLNAYLAEVYAVREIKSHLFASLMNMAEYDRAEGLTAIPFWFNGAKELGCSGYCILSPWSFANS